MFYTLLRLYNQKRLSKEGLLNAVRKRWITKEEYKEIAGEEYEE
ncbi:XkdX family protein [Garciella nitratireducens]|uniref:Phage uncharacterized protein (Phage_XkdX) n=1 Tax=Garciella nitratireducens DSM 15102 TaxID=1121911 RepID=A0A1T4K5I4_9FIRM|nr:XkdX family protein [Garciella nitratireducens]SJZ37689.1 Phage uncharacterised protein (Phage_XkdX) [Garciella nitratireducens DSM 15102]